MSEADKRFGEALRKRARGEAPEGAVPPELLERGAAAVAEMQAVLEELAAVSGEGAAEEGAGA